MLTTAGGTGATHSAPQDAADRLRAETTSSPRDGGFLLLFIAVCTGLIGAGVATSFIVNPYGRFTWSYFEPRAPLVRDEKVALWRAAHDPEVVILGSSHVKKLDPLCVTALTGHTAFNFGLDGGSLDDLRAVVAIILTGPHVPRQVILGLDPGLVSSINGVSRPTMWSRALSRELDVSVEDTVNAYGEMLWSQSALFDDLAVLRRGRQRSHSRSHRADGFLETPTEDAARAAGHYDLDRNLVESSARLKPIYEAINVDPARLQILRSLLVRLHSRGVDVIGFVPPLHPSLEHTLAGNAAYRKSNAEFERAVHDLTDEQLVHLIDASLPAFGGSPNNFLDADHMDAVNTAKLVPHLYARPESCAVQ